MNLFSIFLIQNSLCAGISNPMFDTDFNTVHHDSFLLLFTQDTFNPSVSPALDPFHINITNRYQDGIDDISLIIPYAKVFLEAHLEITKCIFEDSMKEAIEKQLKDFKKRPSDFDFKNEKLIYKMILLNFIKIFLKKYIPCCINQKTLKTDEIIVLKHILKGPTFSEDFFVEKMLDIIIPKEITEKLLNTEKEKIEVIQSGIKNKAVKKLIFENLFFAFAASLLVLNQNLPDFSVYNATKNEEYLNSKIKNNEFLKIIKKIYSKNAWQLSASYENRIMQTPEESKEVLFMGLCGLILENYQNKNFRDIFKKKIFTLIFDNNKLRLPVVIQNVSKNIFPTYWSSRELLRFKELLEKYSNHTLYLSFSLSIEDWLIVFIRQIFSKFKKERFYKIVSEDFPDAEAVRKEILKEIFEEIPEISPFCDDIKLFLVKLKENLKSQTYISFYFDKVEDSIFNDIITKFFEEKKISKTEILHGGNMSDLDIKIRNNVMYCFEYCFKSTLTSHFRNDEFIKKKTIIFE
ncbi:hypothetical protein CWI37_1537p0020 [Hamiltosporidium tvaerminnensis]|uniref:Uncharacterized protein n=1 Tax=Hamiltosporidium tvaerminnensis TaxID=1176355 RepID=A0A4Q9KWC8_9MICR|nr:hypothetical protein LUQ84_002634 [Hamiltosporidium tvaerminnensis]TBT98925.1 hypothetical protein CWI37_1537p0020 [Hamiltosporidium tvaerminnensis]